MAAVAAEMRAKLAERPRASAERSKRASSRIGCEVRSTKRSSSCGREHYPALTPGHAEDVDVYAELRRLHIWNFDQFRPDLLPVYFPSIKR